MRETSMGGDRFRFGETLWTRVLAAKAGAGEALDELIRAYWKPVYHYVRGRGHSIEDAKDLTQGFFGTMLERNFLKTIEPARGKFKSFLLASLRNYLSDQRTRQEARKRSDGRRFVSLQESITDVPASTPEDAFERAWAETVLTRAFERMRGTPYYRPLQMHLQEGLGPSAIARRLACKPKDVENTLARGRKRFRDALREEVLQYVGSPEEAEEEFRFLLQRIS